MLIRWYEWLQLSGGDFAGKTLDELVTFQKRAQNDDRFAILELAESWVQSIPGTAHYKARLLGAVRSFFLHNRAELRRDTTFRIRAEHKAVVGSLTGEEVKTIAGSSNRLYRAISLCMVGGGLGAEEILYFSEHGLDSTLQQLNAGTYPIRVDLPGRKRYKNIRPYYSLLPRDAIEALRAWLAVRPTGSRFIFVSAAGTPVNYMAVKAYWNRRLKRLGLSEAHPHSKSHRTGKNLHELRDVFRTRWQKSGADPLVAEFLMGHTVDPL